MSMLAVLLPVLLAFLIALGQLRENHRRGIAINWPKTLVTILGVIAITALACAALGWRVSVGDELTGGLLFALIMLSGIAGLAVGVNRRWPRAGG